MANSSDLEEEAQAVQEATVNASLGGIQKALQANDIMECEECGGDIEPERKAAMPSAVHCIECMRYLDKKQAHKAKLVANPAHSKNPLTFVGS
jgi:RNA polymerase-binding transcription factor DksA